MTDGFVTRPVDGRSVGCLVLTAFHSA